MTDPIRQLEVSVRQVEGDGEALIYVGGALETRQLGESVQKMVWQMQCLAQEAAAEHEAKRKTELNALQAQINPHFLYNTLDIIVWMVENEQPTEAVRLVTALARFFRISLSGGRNVIPVRRRNRWPGCWTPMRLRKLPPGRRRALAWGYRMFRVESDCTLGRAMALPLKASQTWEPR